LSSPFVVLKWKFYILYGQSMQAENPARRLTEHRPTTAQQASSPQRAIAKNRCERLRARRQQVYCVTDLFDRDIAIGDESSRPGEADAVEAQDGQATAMR
jgi:hypothetical protein